MKKTRPQPIDLETPLIDERLKLFANAGLGRRGARPAKRRTGRESSASERPFDFLQQLAMLEDSGVSALTAQIKEAQRTAFQRHIASRRTSQRFTDIAKNGETTLSPDDRALTQFVDRSTGNRLAIQFGINPRPGYPPPAEDVYSPLYKARAGWFVDWKEVTEPSVLIVSVNANFNGYTCGGWADWDDDWGFAGIGYRVSIWWSKDWEETSPVERIGGTIVMLGDDPIWGGTHYNPLLDLASNGRTPATPIPDLATTFNVGTWGSPMLMSPGNVVHVQFDWIMYVQINGDSAKANLYTGEHGGADLGITVDLETP